ncbi:MAG: NUDIX domain-containing protein [Desulfarculaceae bacterium]|nr:NUDIX domain-containing protein [Desulfarculaceae bacterium]MCF8047249.1 NUDIX domain-containing protein [Desulfarculaceae bacterium]MCF8065772.1 NUDIX domain-containing protein [Desulfarculaceae bacterium]MCF8097806.1 NUDIX domain-containing protein [Desulfarculaceae bacterium]MCF8122337.1 NUDIX domain-containing protein [Desulfarculaceae bacterium]
MAHPVTPRFCASCGGALIATNGLNPGGAPYSCTACGLPVYEDPKVAAAVVVETKQGVLLLRRAQKDRAYGKWILPGGHVDRGEVVPEAAQREVAEETGLDVELTSLLGVYSYPGYPWVLVVYTASANGGRLKASAEALEMQAFAPEELPWDELGYESTAQALRDYLAQLS